MVIFQKFKTSSLRILCSMSEKCLREHLYSETLDTIMINLGHVSTSILVCRFSFFFHSAFFFFVLHWMLYRMHIWWWWYGVHTMKNLIECNVSTYSIGVVPCDCCSLFVRLFFPFSFKMFAFVRKTKFLMVNTVKIYEP